MGPLLVIKCYKWTCGAPITGLLITSLGYNPSKWRVTCNPLSPGWFRNRGRWISSPSSTRVCWHLPQGRFFFGGRFFLVGEKRLAFLFFGK